MEVGRTRPTTPGWFQALLICLQKMNKSELTATLAKRKHLSKAAAADQLDRVVHQVLVNLRKGKPTRFPGLGSFFPGEKWGFRFDAKVGNRGQRGGQ